MLEHNYRFRCIANDGSYFKATTFRARIFSDGIGQTCISDSFEIII